MFAHQVIAWLSKKVCIYNIGIEVILGAIKSSTKYHFGEINKNVESVVQPLVNAYNKKHPDKKFRAYNAYSELVVLPYPLVWFDWSVRAADNHDVLIKHGVLLVQSDKEISIYSFYNDSTMEKEEWMFIPLIVTTEFGSGSIRGSDVPIKEEIKPLIPNYNEELNKENIEESERSVDDIMFKAYLCLLFLNCRNIKVCKRHPDKALQKSRIKKGKLPMFTYHILEIEEMRRRTVVVGNRTVSPTKGVLRDHPMPAKISYYPKESPLFGNPKNVGFFAFKAHRRGNPLLGRIERDYSV